MDEEYGAVEVRADVKFSNGLELKGCVVNGDEYITDRSVSVKDLAGGLRRVEVKYAGGGMNEYADVWLDSCEGISGGGTRIVMRELGYYEREEMKWRSNVEYLAMMMGVEL